MKIRVQFFGQLREVTGVVETEVEMPAGGHIADVIDVLQQKYPALRPYMPSTSFALNDEYVSREQPLRDGNVVGLLPPISGG